MEEVASRVYRLGSRLVSWYLVESDARYTLVDAGMPAHYDQLPKAMAELGAPISAIEGIVLTHAHGDHLGSSVRIKHESAADVAVHVGDEDLALGRRTRSAERHYLWDAWRPFAFKAFLHFMFGGATKAVPHVTVGTFGDGDHIDVPGRPRAVHTPGHTPGSACLHFEDHGILCTGDALVTLNFVTGDEGPTILPRSFNEDTAQALSSLARIENVAAPIVLPGHGEPWTDGVAAAVTAARAVG